PPPPVPAVPAKPVPPPPPASAIAAVVNTQNISELAVYRALVRDDSPDRARARKEILDFLIENALVDQYLVALKMNVDKKDIDDRIEQLKKDAACRKRNFHATIKQMRRTREGFHSQRECALRWENFVAQQGTDKALRDYSDKNKNMFDGSPMHAR